MDKVRDVLKEKYNIDTSVKYGMIIGDNGLIKIQIEPPRPNCDSVDEHSKWLLRMAPSASFDRWSVSAAISERFNGTNQIVERLCHTADVYRKMFAQLSNDYKELDDKCTELEYGDWDK